MGKTSRRLKISVSAELENWPEIIKLSEQGHEIVFIPALTDTDLVIGPKCWLMDPDHKKYLPLAIKAARLRKYGKPKKGDEDA